MDALRWIAFGMGVALVCGTVASVVHTLVLPRHPGRGLSSRAMEAVWALHVAASRRLTQYGDKDQLLALAAPASILVLLAAWLVAGLVGYAFMLWPLGNGRLGGAFEEAGSSMFTLGFATANRPASTVTDFVAAAGRGLECPPPVAAPTHGHHHRQSACTGSAKAIAPAFTGVGDWCIVQG